MRLGGTENKSEDTADALAADLAPLMVRTFELQSALAEVVDSVNQHGISEHARERLMTLQQHTSMLTTAVLETLHATPSGKIKT